MKKQIIIVAISLLSIAGFSRTPKLKVVFVQHIDTTFTLVTYDNRRQIPIDFSKEWNTNVKQALDSNIYTLSCDSMPQSVRHLQPYTIWFSKRNKKLNTWLTDLQQKGFDILLIRYRCGLIDTPYTFLSNAYGLLMLSNEVFSVNGVVAYRISDLKNLGWMGLGPTSDFIKKLDKKDKLAKTIDEVEPTDVEAAKNAIRELDRHIVFTKIANTMNSTQFTDKFNRQ